MSYIVAPTSVLVAIAAQVNASLGLPKAGVDSVTGHTIAIEPGADLSKVHGVTMQYAEVIPKHDDASLGAYVHDEITAPFLAHLAMSPQPLPADWFAVEEGLEPSQE